MSSESHTPHFAVRSIIGQLSLLLTWAVLLAVSFPRPGWWAPAHVALLPLVILAVRGRSARRVGVLTYLVGLAWWAWMLRWLIPVTGPGYLLLAAYCALYPLAFVFIVRAVSRRMHVPLVFIVPLAWVALEYVRGVWVLTGFPWFNLGHTQPTTMIQVADLVGAYGVSFVVAMTSGLLADLLTNPLVSHRGGVGRTVKLGGIVWLVVIVGSAGYGLWRTGQTDMLPDTTGRSLRVAVVQTDVPQDNKIRPTPQQSREDFEQLLDLTRQTAADDPQLVVWPETVVPRALNEETLLAGQVARRTLADTPPTDAAERDSLAYWAAAVDYYRGIVELAVERRLWLLAGAHAHVDLGLDSYRRYNAAYLFDPRGRRIGRYDKVHRVPFGEYILFEDSLPWLASWLRGIAPVPANSLSAGDDFDPLALAIEPAGAGASANPVLWRVGTPICFEDVFSDACRQMIYIDGRKRGDLLVNLTNDGWYPGTDQPLQHERIARLRCVENRVPMARAVNRGVSALIDSAGRVVARVEVDGRRQLVAGAVGGELWRDDRRTLFGRIGDAFALFCVVMSGILLILSALAARLLRSQT